MFRFALSVAGIGRRWLAAGVGAMCMAVGVATANPDPEAGLPFMTVFDPAVYEGHTQVWSAVEDARGLLYFGNYDAVLVYNGVRWGRIPVTEGTFVRALAIDERDVLWIGGVSQLGYAAPSPDGGRRFTSLKDKLPTAASDPGDIWRVLPLPGGAIFQSNRWLLYWKDGAFLTLPLRDGSAWQLLRVGEETWVTSATRGWFRLEVGSDALTLDPLPESVALPQTTLNFSVSLPGGRRAILGAGKKGLFLWDGQALTPFKTEVDEELAKARMYRATRLADGRIAVATLESGAFVFDPEGHLLQHLDSNAGTPDDTTLNVFADSHGALWLCLARGTVRVDARPWLTWFGPANGAPKAALDLPVRVGDHLYVATTDGLSEIVHGTGMTPARMIPVPAVRSYLNFVEPADGGLLCGGSGLLYYKDGKATELPGDAANVFSIAESRSQPGRWFSMADGDFRTYRRDKGAWVDEGRIPGLSNIRSAFEDSEGTWWLGTPSSGAFKVRFPAPTQTGPGKPEITTLTEADGLPPRSGWVRVVSYHQGPLLMSDFGLYPFNPSTRRFETVKGFGPDSTLNGYTVRAETDSPEGFWMAAKPPGTAELVAPVTLGLAGPGGWKPFDLPELARLDDVDALRFEAGNADRPPVLWVAGHSGLVRIDLLRGRPQGLQRVPRVIVAGAETSDGASLPVAGHWDLPANRDSLNLHFASPDLATDPRLLFETVLQQGSSKKVFSGPSADRDFSALATGTYVLTARAKGNDNVWSEPVSITFRIEPPWWLSPWASAGYLVLGVGAVSLVIRQRTSALRRRAEELERVVAQRTEELRKKNVELERLHRLELDEKIAARLSEAKARLELLRYQLNPHFLMNAFTALRSLVFTKPADAAEMVSKLADFCRIALTRTDENGGTVADETQLIETYLATEKARWRQELQVEVIVEPAVLDRRFPPFLLQPLVENAIKYGGRTSPIPLQVEVKMSAMGPVGIRIEVNNTGSWIDPNGPDRADSTGIGLDNLRQRLARYYPQAHELQFDHSAEWVRITLLLASEPKDPFVTSRVV